MIFYMILPTMSYNLCMQVQCLSRQVNSSLTVNFEDAILLGN